MLLALLKRQLHGATLFLACFSFGAAILPSCHQEKPDITPADSVLVAQAREKVAYWLDSSYYTHVHSYLDSFYQVNHIRSPLALINKYEQLAELYYFHIKDTMMLRIYLDSMAQSLMQCRNRDPQKTLSLHFLSGHLATAGERYEEAFKFYYRGKLLIDSIGSGCGNVRYYTTLGQLLYMQHKYAEAKEYQRKVYESALACDPSDTVKVVATQRAAYSNIGICLENDEQYDSALYYYNKALALADQTAYLFAHKKLSQEKFKGVVLGNKGGVLTKLKRYAEAEKALKQSLVYNYRPEGEFGDAVLTKIKLAELYLVTGRLQKCYTTIGELEKDTKKSPYVIADMRLANLKQRYYSATGESSLALNSLKTYHKLSDSVAANSTYNILTNADHLKEFEMLERNYELQLLKHRNEIKDRYLLLAFLMALLTLIIVVLLLVRRRANQAHIHALTRMNAKVQNTNEKLQTSLQSLQYSQEENTRIIKMIAHDLRSPIVGIMSLVRLIKVDDLTKEEVSEYIDLVEKSGNNALAFIDDLLHINKTNLSFTRTATDIQQLLESCISIMQTQASRKRQQIHLESGSVIIPLNEEKIWRVINNLIANAIKFSPLGTDIYVASTLKAGFVRISVRDEGVGIPDSLKDKMFNLSSGTGRTGTSGEQSFGLGLVISRQIVEAHGGRIWFESEENKGATFFVELPLH